MNPKTLQYLMGHSDIGVTMNTYTHLGLDDAKNEMIRMEELEQARKEAKAQADHTVEETTAKVDAMLAKAQEDIRMERENAMRQMKGDVAELAMKAAAKVIGKNSGADQDLSLYDQFIEEAGDPDDSDRR